MIHAARHTDDVRRLLVLDDDALVAETVGAIARASGFAVVVASEATQFFALLDSWEPTHIALDLRMPDMDGLEVIAALSERGSTARVIIASGVGDRVLAAAARSAAEHGLQVGAVLAKPFTARAFRSALLEASATAPVSVPVMPGPEVPEDAAARSSSNLDRDVLKVIRSGALTIALQPKVRCDSGAVAGFEALARWPAGRTSALSPGTFLPVAARLGLMDRVTDIVLTRAASWVRDRPAIDGVQLTVAVNVPATLVTEGVPSPDGVRSFEAWAERRCADLDVDPAQVLFELTETDAMSDSVASLDVLTRLRMKGFQLSIDDFGTGYSSLARLARLPFSELKIDRSFVAGLGRSGASDTIVRAAVDLAHGLRLECVAEGVEDARVLGLLRDLGCDLAQGYHLARPMEPDAATAWLGSRSAGGQS